jgi:hypothetical protein
MKSMGIYEIDGESDERGDENYEIYGEIYGLRRNL